MTEIVEQKIYLLFFSSVLYTPIVKSLIAPRALMLASFIFSFIAIAFSCYKISSPLSILAIITLSNFLYSILFLPSGISICVAISLHNLFLRQPHLSHYAESQILLSYKRILPVRSFGIRSRATYSFYPLHNSAEFYLCLAIAFPVFGGDKIMCLYICIQPYICNFIYIIPLKVSNHNGDSP